MFTGAFVAIVTPFSRGRLDLKLLAELVEFQIQNGIGGIVPVGTTGEAPTLASDEKARVIRAVVKAARRRVPVVAGTGTNDTRTSVEYTRMARQLGADGALLVNPYYNKPSQEGLYLHFEAVARATPLPLCLYNIPGRTAVNLSPETIARLARIRTVQALKEASGNLEAVTAIRNLCAIKILSGDDALTLPILALGGTGVISVAANIVPRAVADLCRAAAESDLRKAREIHDRHFALFKALFVETNPVPVKTALRLMGRGTGELRLPLCPMGAANEARLAATLRHYRLI